MKTINPVRPISLSLTLLFSSLTAKAISPSLSLDNNTNIIITTNTSYDTTNIGNTSAFNQLTIKDGATLHNSKGSIGNTSNAVHNTVIVSGSGTHWINDDTLCVGNKGSANQLTITTAAEVQSKDGYIGSTSGADNTVTVTGQNSRWINDGDLTLGQASTGNQLNIKEQATVSTGDAYIGKSLTAANNSVTVTDSGSRWNTDRLYVGSNSSSNHLALANSAQVESADSYIGNIANNNEVTVTGRGSQWTSTGEIDVGFDGANNQLTIDQGAVVNSKSAHIGKRYQTNNASNNTVRVTGIGSSWVNSDDLVIGNQSHNNRLIISEGASVANTSGYIGYGQGASNNSVLVNGTGSTWVSSDQLMMGYQGTKNTLTISDGGQVRVGNVAPSNLSRVSGSSTLIVGDTRSTAKMEIANQSTLTSEQGYLGLGTDESGSVTITGAGSSWNNSGALFIGDQGTNNHLTISDGAAVDSNSGYIGQSSSASYNDVVVTGPNSTWNNSSDLVIGIDGSANQLALRDGATVTAAQSVIGLGATATSNTVIVTGAGSSWINANDLSIGQNGSNNQLSIEKGAIVSDTNGHIGQSHSASNNAVLVSGAGTRWNHTSALYIGNDGSANQLTIRASACVANAQGVIGTESDHNAVFVTGNGSKWVNTQDLSVGRAGSNNQLTISDGANVTDATGYIGRESSANNNRVLVTGAGSSWNHAGELFIGYIGSDNELTITNVAKVANTFGTIGYDVLAANNSVLVTGVGSSWVNTQDLSVGQAGSNNQLTIGDGANVTDATGYIGRESSADNNRVLVTGAGSSWNHAGELFIGYIGSDNELTITNVAKVANTFGTIGYDLLAANNSVLVTGVGSSWVNTQDVSVGQAGSNNQLTISDGANVTDATGYIGRESSADNNRVLVTGTGSSWNHSGELFIGYIGSDNELTITNVAKVANTNGTIGYNLLAANNSVLVTGAGSSWVNTQLTVGQAGSNNQLTISDGAKVTDATGYIGRESSADNNRVLVTGAGSSWNHSGELFIGYIGSDNELTITNVAKVANTNGTIGYDLLAANNSVLVTGVGSSWVNTQDVSVGQAGSNNQLTISDGAKVTDATGYIGRESSADNNRVLVTGAGSSWNHSNNLFVGYQGHSNLLTVADQGHVLVGDVQTNNLPVLGTHAGIIIGDTKKNAELIIANGSSVISDQGYIGLGINESGSVTVTGAGSSWTHSNDLIVGYNGSANGLTISNGATVTDASGWIGVNGSSCSNSVYVTGAGSSWDHLNDLFIGVKGANNHLLVSNQGSVNVGGNLDLLSNSLLRIGDQALVTASNYYQSADATLLFGISTNSNGSASSGLLKVTDTAEFEAGAKLSCYNEITDLKFEHSYTVKLVDVGNQLIAGGVTNPVTLANFNLLNTLLDVKYYLDGNDVMATIHRQHLQDAAGFCACDYASDAAARVACEIDAMAEAYNPSAECMLNFINKQGLSGPQLKAALQQQYDQGPANYRHEQLLVDAGTMVKAQNHQTLLANAADHPVGASGPDAREPDLHCWIKGYGTWGKYDSDSTSAGSDLKSYGSLIGVDKTFGSSLIGVAAGQGTSAIDQTNRDSSDADTQFGMLYASNISSNWFSDLSLSYGRSDIKTTSAAGFGATGDLSADTYALSLGGGKKIKLSDGGSFIQPEAAVQASYYKQESYTEKMVVGVDRDIDAFDHGSIQSRVGGAYLCEKKYESFILTPELRAFWLHDFNAHDLNVGYSLAGSADHHSFGVQTPVEDLFELGVGISARIQDRVKLSLDVDRQFGATYNAYSIAGKLEFTF